MNQKIVNAMEYMDEKYIGEVLDAGKKASARKALMRWGAVAACFVLMVALCIGFAGGVPAQPQGSEPQLNHTNAAPPAATAPHTDGIILPPSRSSEGGVALSILVTSFEDLVADSDAIAWVRVGNWLGERTGEMIWDRTFYYAEVLQCYKGTLGNSIVLEQSGSSESTLKGYPLLTYGNEVLVFLQGGESRPFQAEGYSGVAFENSYCILGEYTSLFDVATDASGASYAIARADCYASQMDDRISNLKYESGLNMRLCNALAEIDTVQQIKAERTNYIFSMEDIANLLK